MGGASSTPLSADSPSFLQRCRYWHDALDPAHLLASEAEIRNRREELQSPGKDGGERSDQMLEAQRLVQVSVHPDTGHTLPTLFRPAAYALVAGSLVFPTLMSPRGPATALICQIPFQAYNTGFTVVNGNLSAVPNAPSLSQHPLFLSGTALYVACVGAAPLLVMKKLGLTTLEAKAFGRFLQPPLFALLGGLNVLLARVSERDHGIQVTNTAGNVVGVSRNAGKKAVRETAMSRAALFGVTALVPSLVRRSPYMLQRPGTFSIVQALLGSLTFIIMTPVSISIFPQCGTIRRSDLEDELKDKTTDSELFYNRGI